MVDILFVNGLVIDTEQKVSRIANVAVEGDKIVDVSDAFLPARRIVDIAGMVICPGFIDAHAHLDGYDYGGKLSAMQGITTTVGGNCGLSPIDMHSFFEAQEQQGYVLNQMMCVGHSFSLRKEVGIHSTAQRASASQVDAMVRLAAKALEDGACGVSLGLDYSPGASLAEIDAMAKVASDYGRVLSAHTRLFTQNDLYSLYEILAATKRADCRLLLSHFVYQYSGFGSLEPALKVVDHARSQGLDVWIDTGMYTDWATYVDTATFDEQTLKDISIRFGDMVAATGKYTGQRLNRDLYDLLRAKYPNDSIICYSGSPAEIEACLVKPYAMISTDAGPYAPGEGHPQIAASFPRYLRKCVRGNNLLPMEEAIYKATLLPCQTFGIPNKGVIAAGYDADIVVFDPKKVRERATMPDVGEPDTPPVGIPYVMVNGTFAVDNNKFTYARSGRVIRF